MIKRVALLIFFSITHFLYSLDFSNSYISESEKLIDQQKYKSAFDYLTENEEKIGKSDVVVQKVKILLNYFVHSTMHQMFALKDIPENESVYDYRGREGTYQYILYKPDEAIIVALETDQNNGELYFWLGQYYYEVLEKYNEQWLLSNEELRSKIIENYESAIENDYSDKIVHSNLGQIYLQTKSYEKARDQLLLAIELESSNPGYNHNLAVAYFNLGAHEQAVLYAEKAAQLYSETYYKADSCYLTGIILINLRDYERSIDFMEKGRDLVPDQYRFYDKLIDLYLYNKDYEKAHNSSKALFNLYPTNPSVMSSIINYYNSYKVLEEANSLIDELLDETLESEAKGNLLYNKALVTDALGDHEQAVIVLLMAKDQFEKVFPEDHQVFQAIDTLINQIQ